MTDELPDLESFCASVARLHLNSVSPNNKFGFSTTTYMGPLPQDNTWCDTWEEYFKQGMTRMLDLERNVQGPNHELEQLTDKLYEKVIPRLLRPLTFLKSIKPVLIHGDLWYGNCCTDNTTGKPIVFDACVFWAHNECTLFPMQAFSPLILNRRGWNLARSEVQIRQLVYQNISQAFPCLSSRGRP